MQSVLWQTDWGFLIFAIASPMQPLWIWIFHGSGSEHPTLRDTQTPWQSADFKLCKNLANGCCSRAQAEQRWGVWAAVAGVGCDGEDLSAAGGSIKKSAPTNPYTQTTNPTKHVLEGNPVTLNPENKSPLSFGHMDKDWVLSTKTQKRQHDFHCDQLCMLKHISFHFLKWMELKFGSFWEERKFICFIIIFEIEFVKRGVNTCWQPIRLDSRKCVLADSLVNPAVHIQQSGPETTFSPFRSRGDCSQIGARAARASLRERQAHR